jgi:hypothetical protein
VLEDVIQNVNNLIGGGEIAGSIGVSQLRRTTAAKAIYGA